MRRGWLTLSMGILLAVLWGCMIGSPTPTPLASIPVSTQRPTPTVVIFEAASLPPVTPVTEAEPRRCPKAPRSRLIVNERGRVTNNGKALNIRTSAGTQYSQIGQMPPGSIFLIIDGPRCGGEYVWFYILYRGMEGWIAEGDTENTYAEPYLGG